LNTSDLWSANKKGDEPLPVKLRPKRLDGVIGQDGIIKKGAVLREAIEKDRLFSCIFYGPPGCGKTTVGMIIGAKTSNEFIHFSASKFPMSKLKPLLEKATKLYDRYGTKTVLFVDEIHRFNKLQQDVLLPYVENGEVVLIGATTENPSFELNPALLSRCKVFVFHQLSKAALKKLLEKSLNIINTGREEKRTLRIQQETADLLLDWSAGDARNLLNFLQILTEHTDRSEIYDIDTGVVNDVLNESLSKYSKTGEEHYNLISAFIKSMRGSDPDAAVYYLARMLESGEDPIYVARRIIRFASEDIGLADPNAMGVAVAAFQAANFIGMPECNTSLTQAAVYMAVSPKSNRLYLAYKGARDEVKRHPDTPVPLKLRNPVTNLMSEMDYGRGYRYAHDEPNAFVLESYLPERLSDVVFYRPSGHGREKRVRERLEQLWKRTYEERKDQ